MMTLDKDNGHVSWNLYTAGIEAAEKHGLSIEPGGRMPDDFRPGELEGFTLHRPEKLVP